MLKFEQICELLRLVGETGVAKVELEQAGSRMLIEGAPVPPVVQMSAEDGLAAPVVTIPAPAAAPEAHSPADNDEDLIVSPIVGTFYRAPNPDADAYVKVGDVIHPGQVLCIVEAMKLMNEIQSEISGTIVKVFPDNAEPVEFGQALFAIQPA